MSTLQSIAGKSSKCSDYIANTGKLGCLQEFGTPLSMIAVPKGYVLKSTQEVNLEWVNQEIQKGSMIPLIGASSFEDQSGEDTYSTNSAGVERLNLKGLPKYKLMFEEGHEFYRQMSRLESFKSKDFIIIDDEGSWAMTIDSEGNYGGFSAGQVTPEMRKTKVQGGDAESKSLVVQFLDRLEWDENYEIFSRKEIGISSEDIQGVNGIAVSFANVPADGESSLLINAVLKSDKSTKILGLENAEFTVDVDGTSTVVTPTATANEGEYTLAVSSLSSGNLVSVRTFDSALNSTAINIDGILYRSLPLSATIAS